MLGYFRWLMFAGILAVLPIKLMAQSLPDFVELVEQYSPAVVNISTTQKIDAHPWSNLDIPEHSPFNEFFRHFFGEQGGMPPPPEEAESLGSGFILSNDGYVLTNHHVVADADEIIVRLSDKRELKAKVIGSDKYTDVALLKVDAANLPVVKIGSSEKIRVGSWVLAIGSPFGFDHSVTAGIVSAKGRNLPRASYVPFIQTDVAINPGNSGGPLFDLQGEVIGINSQIYSRTGGFMGLSFAIPIEVAMDVVKQIKTQGSVSRGWLGVYVQEVTQELAESFGLDKPVGALVSQVIKGSPAEKAGFKAGDVILAFNDREILDSSDLPPLVGRVSVGQKAQVRLLRDGRSKVVSVLIEKLPEDDDEVLSEPQKSPSMNRIGLSVSDLDRKMRSELGRGVLVAEVLPGSVSQHAGIRVGDIILQIDRKNVESAAEFRKIVAKLPTGRMIPVLLRRQDADQFIVLKIPKSE